MRFIVCISLLFFLPLLQFGQHNDQVVQLADHAYKNGQYSLALLEYNRVVYHNKEADGQLLYRIGECYQKLGDNDNALQFFDRAFFTAKNDTFALDALLKKTSIRFENESYGLALSELLGVELSLSEEGEKRRALYIGAAYFLDNQFERAQEYFQKCTHDTAGLNEIFSDRKLLYFPNPTLAVLLSAVLPGLGQTYSGDWKNGVNSLLINAAFTAMAVNISQTIGPLDALISIIPWFQRYYMGGVNKAGDMAFEKRRVNRIKTLGKIADFIEKGQPELRERQTSSR